MPEVEVMVEGGRSPTFIKRAVTAEDGDRLSHECTVLRTLAGHDGVVQLLSHSGAGAGFEMRLAWIGSHTLDTIGPLNPTHAAGTVAALADTIADLHGSGVVHTRLTPDHVLVGGGGRPVLCGLAGAGGPNDCSPAGDVAALGELLRELLAVEDDFEPIPARRWGIARRTAAGFHRKALLTLADHATADEHAARPSARALAEAIRTAVPGAALPQAPDPGHDEATPLAPDVAPPLIGATESADDPAAAVAPHVEASPAPDLPAAAPVRVGALASDGVGPHRFRRAVPIVAALVGITLLLLGLREVTGDGPPTAIGSSRPRPGRPDPDPTTSRDAAGSTTSVSIARPAGRTPPPSSVIEGVPRGCPTAPAPSADIDGDRCPDPVRIVEGLLATGGVTYRVGRPGDVLRVEDWQCDGKATLALLRVATGEVFVFRQWARAGHDLTAEPETAVPGATGLHAADANGDGCPELTVERRDGGSMVVAVPIRR